MSVQPVSSIEPLAALRLQKYLHAKVLVISAMVMVSAAGWVFLWLMLKGFATEIALSEAGPGMAALQQYFTGDGDIGFARALYLSICGPAGQVKLLNSNTAIISAIGFYLPMWFAMVIAMMLPASSPLMLAYIDIAQAASRKQITTVHPGILLAGFLTVWLAFGIAAAILQWQFTLSALMADSLVLTHPLTMAVILAVAGFYQISPLKQACLVKCRMPMPFLMSRWSQTRSGIFKMGLDHGVACLACCWALMLVMFVAGLMNLVWMVILTLLMLLEKTMPNPTLMTRISGAALLVWSVVIIGKLLL